jgi:hypothetical protein
MCGKAQPSVIEKQISEATPLVEEIKSRGAGQYQHRGYLILIEVGESSYNFASFGVFK